MLRSLPSREPEALVVVASGRRVFGWRMPETFVVQLPGDAQGGQGGHCAGPAGAFVVADDPKMGGWFGLAGVAADGSPAVVSVALIDSMKAKE
jgi:hypothetical protein